MPTSIMIASGFIQWERMSPGTPHAAITISAPLTDSASCSYYVLEKQTVTNALYLLRRRYIGIPTMLLRPIRVIFLPSSTSSDPSISFRIATTPSGVHDMKYGACLLSAKLPTLNGCSPSTSFSGPIILMIRSWSRCSGKGSWTRTPLTLRSRYSSLTFAIRSYSEVCNGSLKPLLPMPISSQALILILTYDSDWSRSPTRICPRTGPSTTEFFYFIVSILSRSFPRIEWAKALPSKIFDLYFLKSRFFSLRLGNGVYEKRKRLVFIEVGWIFRYNLLAEIISAVANMSL